MVVLLLTTPVAFSCPVDETWPASAAWVCAVNHLMAVQDQPATYARTLELITDSNEIRSQRRPIRSQGDEICRRYQIDRTTRPLLRILRKQRLLHGIDLEKTNLMAWEIAAASTASTLVVCERQQLEAEGGEARDTYFYYFRFGGVRMGKHLLLKLDTSWNIDL